MAEHPLQQATAVQGFRCLGDACEDTCCKGWGMQLTSETVAKYQAEAPELLEAVTSGEAEHIMRRDALTDYCVKFDKGWCGIHARYGEAFLGDACHFFPRVTRSLGEVHLMTASLSCPEIVRLGIMRGQGFRLADSQADRLPYSLKNYLPQGLSANEALAVHEVFLGGVIDETLSPERAACQLRSVAASLQTIDAASWPAAAAFYWKNAQGRLPTPEANIADPFNLLNALQGLIGAAKVTKRERLMQTVSDMETALGVRLDWERLSIHTNEDSLQRYQAMVTRWQNEWRGAFDSTLRLWLQAQLSVSCFPFAGFGHTLNERAGIIGVRFATLKLALMSACMVAGVSIDEAQTVRVIQSLSRFLDHLADPSFSLQIYNETGWLREARLRSLVGDA